MPKSTAKSIILQTSSKDGSEEETEGKTGDETEDESGDETEDESGNETEDESGDETEDESKDKTGGETKGRFFSEEINPVSLNLPTSVCSCLLWLWESFSL